MMRSYRCILLNLFHMIFILVAYASANSENECTENTVKCQVEGSTSRNVYQFFGDSSCQPNIKKYIEDAINTVFTRQNNSVVILDDSIKALTAKMEVLEKKIDKLSFIDKQNWKEIVRSIIAGLEKSLWRVRMSNQAKFDRFSTIHEYLRPASVWQSAKTKQHTQKFFLGFLMGKFPLSLHIALFNEEDEVQLQYLLGKKLPAGVIDKEISKLFVMYAAYFVMQCAAIFWKKDKTGYQYYDQDKFWYKFHKECKSWPEARQVCQQEGGDLISLNENNFDFFRNVSRSKAGDCQHVWVGATDISSEGQWYWLNGERVSSVLWQPAQPDNALSNEHCGDLINFFDFRLNDHVCSYKEHFICQIV